MSLAALPDVLCQSLMRMLDVPSLLRLARCSHRLAALSRAPFAWTNSSLTFHGPPHDLLRHLNSTPSLQLLAELKFHWLAVAFAEGQNQLAHVSAEEPDVAALLSALNRGTLRLVELHVERRLQVREELLSSVLSSERVHPHLRVLSGASLRLSREVGDLITRMPRLHTLSSEDESGSAAFLAGLPQLPSLTDVTLSTGPDGFSKTKLPIIAQCSGLRRLTLVQSSLAGSKFRHFFASRHMRQLQFLGLHRLESLVGQDEEYPPTGNALDAEVSSDPLPAPDADALGSAGALDGLAAILNKDVWAESLTHPADYIATFRRMSELTEIEFVECYGLDGILPHVVHAPSLRRVVIEPGLNGPREDAPSFPSAAVLTAVLQSAPSLHVVLRLPPKIPHEDCGLYSHITQRRAKLRAMFGGGLAEGGQPRSAFGPRFTLQHESGYEPGAAAVASNAPPLDPLWATLMASLQANSNAAAAAGGHPQSAQQQFGADQCKQQ